MLYGSYSPEDVIILIAGVIPVTGLSDGTFVEITKEENPYNTKVTADGIISRSYTSNPLYTVNLTLHSASSANDVLTKIWMLDELTQRGKFPVLIKDALGSSLFFSPTSWISSVPKMNFGKEISDRQWTFTCSNPTINIGGNEDSSGLLKDLGNTAISLVPALNRIF